MGIMIQRCWIKTNKHFRLSLPLMINWMALRSDMCWCNGWQAHVLTLPDISWWPLIRVWGWFLLSTRDHSVAPHPSQPEPLWTNSNKNSGPALHTTQDMGSKETVQHQSRCRAANQFSSAAIQRSIFMIKDRTAASYVFSIIRPCQL